MAKTKAELMNDLFKKCNLTGEDVHKHKFYTIITRSGIEKVQAAYNINICYDIVKLSDDHKHCLIKAVGIMGDARTETYGECSPTNNQNGYPVAMAEKRALSRIVLKLAGLYSQGVFGEDEAEDFAASKNVKIKLDKKTFDAMINAASTHPERVSEAMAKYSMTESQEEQLLKEVHENI